MTIKINKAGTNNSIKVVNFGKGITSITIEELSSKSGIVLSDQQVIKLIKFLKELKLKKSTTKSASK